ncbi:hypothetical protein CC1G_01762 [Coprinopsis cinerea okayama7|uniref:AB hydrolase-1 domain-containing protein n=1 Tax=Coprinopsis cinerea (strain Okayama-7 / 130 / ATCC MYA-4618 / FGSC 9003) TaxID=240176 RepID=A8N2C2_COPC7|nr:hypothetical protein CC1G_01762 [Coprinopsis cinerea okayama7\|eukprot:XP_001829082.2 hypothetical protein CC1G_01762 [Coprinopsis cinerea okayama7\
MLPHFLRSISSTQKHKTSAALNAVFEHNPPLDTAHAHWWPPKIQNTPPKCVLLFVPGNPGLIEFYTPFLEALYNRDTSGRLAILAHAHIGHTPGVGSAKSDHGLTSQVQSAIEAFDALQSAYPADTKIVLIGHSVGSWICSQVLKARTENVHAVFLLFPTLSYIGDTPNGRRLWRIFTPTGRWIVSKLGHLARLVPVQVLGRLFPEWPSSQLEVLKDLVGDPRSIVAALTMASDEMHAIKELDVALFESCKGKLRFYYAERDDWVGEERERVLKVLHTSESGIPVEVVHDEHGIPHAFCIMNNWQSNALNGWKG